MSKLIQPSSIQFFQAFQHCVEQLWIVGLMLCCLLSVQSLKFLKGEAFEWTEYLILGFIFIGGVCLQLIPAWLNFLNRSIRLPPLVKKAFRVLRFFLACFGLVMILKISLHKFIPGIAFAVLAQLLIGGALYLDFLKQKKNQNGLLLTIQNGILFFLSLPAIWIFSFKIIWWKPYTDWFAEAPYRTFILLLLLGLVSVNVLPTSGLLKPKSNGFSPLDAIAILLFFIASLRTDSIFWYPASLHHWSAIVHPAFLMRQGGWLFWDVPSQYGFLNTLLIAILPTPTVWQSFFLLNALLLFLTAVLMFAILRSIRAGASNTFFAFSVTLSAIFLLAGFPNDPLPGPFPTPAIGPYRFFWCFALLAVLLWFCRSSREVRLRRAILGIGCLCWLIGVLWSFESAIYCSVIWIPSYSLVSLQWINDSCPNNANNSRLERIEKNRKFLFAIAIPPISLLAVILILIIYYQFQLGHLPDFTAYAEYSSSFGSGFGSLPVDLKGPVQALLLVFCLLLMAASLYIKSLSNYHILSVLFGAIALFWASSSYYVGRSHNINATNLSPMFCMAIAVTLFVFSKYPVNQTLEFWIKASFIPVLTVVMLGTFGNIPAITQYLSAPQVGYQEIDKLVPTMSRSLEETLAVVQVKPTDSVLFLEPNFVNEWSVEKRRAGFLPVSTKPWLPLPPLGLFIPLSEQRVKLYIARFVERTQLSGWLVEGKTPLDSQMTDPIYKRLVSWVYEQINQTHTPIKEFENTEWKTTYFKYGRDS